MKHRYWVLFFLVCLLTSCMTKKIETPAEKIDLSTSEDKEIAKSNAIVIESNVKGKQEEVSDIITTSPLVNHKYVLKSIGDNPSELLKNSHLPYIVININGSIYGFSGCNRLLGQVDLKEIQNGFIDFTGLGVTRIICDISSSKLENIFLSTLSQVRAYKIEDSQLILQNKNSEDVLSFSSEDTD